MHVGNYNVDDKLKESEERFRILVDNAPEAIVLLDVESGRFVDVNKNAEMLYGLPREELLKVGPIDLSPETQPSGIDSNVAAREWIQQAVEGQAPVFEWTHQNASGKPIPTEVRLVRLFYNGRMLIRGSVSDISDRKTREAQLSQYVREIVRSNKELEEFASIASHDLRAPIASIVNWTQMLHRMLPPSDNSELEKTLGYVERNAKQAMALINDLLALARVNTASPITAVDLNLVVAKVIEELTTQTECSFDIQCEKLPRVTGVATYLESLFKNLLQNALLYRDTSRRAVIQIRIQSKADHYLFSVQDNGIGIAKENTETIFGMFTRLRTDPSTAPGSGIGLAICKKVVELSGGTIWVESTVGQGSTFLFKYPKAGDEK